MITVYRVGKERGTDHRLRERFSEKGWFGEPTPNHASKVKQMSTQTTRTKEFGHHSVVREIDRDETGTPYECYRCTECGHEHVSADSFNHVKECE